MMRRGRWVHPNTHEIIKFMPSNPQCEAELLMAQTHHYYAGEEQ